MTSLILAMALLCNADIVAASPGGLTANLTIKLEGIAALPAKELVAVKGSYRAGQEAGSGSSLTRHQGTLEGTLSPEGKLSLTLKGVREGLKEKVTLKVTASLVKKGGKWLLVDVTEKDVTKK